MATQSVIIAEDWDGMFIGIYCHNDGYPEGPHGVGHKLHTYYNDVNKARKLVELGDLSSVGEDLESCCAYHRDRGEDWDDVQPRRGPTPHHISEMFDISCCYIFREGYWSMTKRE